MTQYDHLIIGAGIAGLTAARRISQAGQTHILLEKSRGVGGRVATRRLQDHKGRADHGAIFLKEDSPDLKAVWGDTGEHLAKLSAPADLDPSAQTFVDGINALPKFLAVGLNIRLNHSVSKIFYEEGLWHSESLDGSRVCGKNLILTCPLPQSSMLLQSHPDLAAQVMTLSETARYRPLWTVIVVSSSPQKHAQTFHGYREHPHRLIQSLCEQSAKGIPHSEGVYVLHATEAFSRQYLEADTGEIIRLIKAALSEVGFDDSLLTLFPHRWRYAFVDEPLGTKIWTSQDWPGFVLAGDFCLGSTLTKAAVSGLTAADHLLAKIQQA